MPARRQTGCRRSSIRSRLRRATRLALAAALGDDLEAPVATDAPVHWRLIEIAADDDPRCRPMSSRSALHVTAPPELRGACARSASSRAKPARACSRISNAASGWSRVEGDLWRWDGFSAQAGGMTPAAASAWPSATASRALFAQGKAGARRRSSGLPRPIRRPRRAHAAAQGETAAACASSGARRRLAWRRRASADRHGAAGARDRGQARGRCRRQGARRSRPRRGSGVPRSRPQDALALLDEGEDAEALLAAAQVNPRAAGRSSRVAADASHRRSNASSRARTRRGRRPSPPSASAGPRAAPAPTSRSPRSKERIAETQPEIASTRSDCPGMIERAAPEAHDRAAPGGRRTARNGPPTRSPPPIAPTGQRRRRCAPHRAPCPTSARPAPASKPGSKARATRRQRGSPAHPRAARLRARRLPGARRLRQTATRCRRLEEADSQLTRLKADRERLGGVNLQADDDLTASPSSSRAWTRRSADVEQAIAKLRARHRPDQQRGPQPPAGGLRHGQRPFPAPVHDAVRRRRSAARDDRGRGPAGRRPRDHRQAARQEAGDAVAALGRRAVADGAGADLRGVPDQPVADLRARRGRRAARRRQRRPLLHADGEDGRPTRRRASWSSRTIP